MQTAPREIEFEIFSEPSKRGVVKLDGNVAYINSGFARQKEKPPVKQPVRQPVKQSVKKSAKQPVASAKNVAKPKTGVVSTLFVMFMAFCAMAVLISRFAAVCTIGAENNELQESIDDIQAQIETIQVDIELKDDLEYVLDTAQDDLGMKYPDQNQVLSIDTDGDG